MSLLGKVLKRAFGRRGPGKTRKSGGDIPALLERAAAFSRAKQPDDARVLWREVLDVDPSNREALLGLGMLAAWDEDLDDARRFLEKVVRFHPDWIDGHNALANLARIEGRWREARAGYCRALELEPESVAVLTNLGTCLRDMGATADALSKLTRALEIDPDNAGVLLELGTAQIDAGDLDAAGASLRRALVLAPGMEAAHAALGHLLLLQGDFSAGWKAYDRHHRIEHAGRKHGHAYPYWEGEPIGHERVLVRAEQGLGDQIMFASCLPDLQARVRSIIMECDPRLAPIFARSFPAIRVYPMDARDNAERWRDANVIPDKQVFLSSLPRHFRNSWDAFPARAAYLKADPEKVDRWRAKLARLGPGLKIGFSWRGGMPQTRQAMRSIPLSDWAPLFETCGCNWVSLQYGDVQAEIERLARPREQPLHCWREAIDDYEETAALIAALDLVISVQTAAVHLAGALGQRAWVLVPFAPEWRYLARGERLPWYASVEVLRQARPHDWAPVLAAVRARLTVLERSPEVR